ncbi:MAG: hypothetical protein K2Q06_01235 [Parvularculaceae bacterium]|nr:hypothetical protein [Parvularculaceae bacterium]
MRVLILDFHPATGAQEGGAVVDGRRLVIAERAPLAFSVKTGHIPPQIVRRSMNGFEARPAGAASP